MKFYAKLLLVPVIVLIVLDSCSKKGNTQPTQPIDFPTEDLQGRYLWHNSADTIFSFMDTDGIDVIDDSTIKIHRDDYSSYPYPVYRLTNFVDSQMIFSDDTWSIVYDIRKRQVIWNHGDDVLYGVPGQTTKWAPMHEAKLEEQRLWDHYETYYVNYCIGCDTSVRLPDTVETAFALFSMVSGSDKTHLLLAGADSTGLVYQQLYYNPEPNSMHVVGAIVYRVANGSISMHYREYGPFSDSHSLYTR